MNNEYREYDYYSEGSLIRKEWNSFAEKEVPNVKITLYDYNGKERGSFFNDTVVGFYEEINSDIQVHGHSSKMIISFACLSPKILDLLREYSSKYAVETEEIWRNSKTGKDQFFMGPIRTFKHMKLRYQTFPEGDPAKWYLILYNKVEDIQKYQKIEENLMEIPIE